MAWAIHWRPAACRVPSRSRNRRSSLRALWYCRLPSRSRLGQRSPRGALWSTRLVRYQIKLLAAEKSAVAECRSAERCRLVRSRLRWSGLDWLGGLPGNQSQLADKPPWSGPSPVMHRRWRAADLMPRRSILDHPRRARLRRAAGPAPALTQRSELFVSIRGTRLVYTVRRPARAASCSAPRFEIDQRGPPVVWPTSIKWPSRSRM
jgi:hypothetical protein